MFDPWISDATVENRRHSGDIWVAQANPGDRLSFTVRRASSYKTGARWDKADTVQQLQFNPPNLPLFRQGTAAFWGDYIDLGGSPSSRRHGCGGASAAAAGGPRGLHRQPHVRAPPRHWSDTRLPLSPALPRIGSSAGRHHAHL